ncbi:hypothetical protein DFJ74DRAFT_677853 [Hyaloraphidium curvatum]|nr:hypothetical protein DFJ74DRAFT_677853 [Hyaloraphidium curvatum]
MALIPLSIPEAVRADSGSLSPTSPLSFFGGEPPRAPPPDAPTPPTASRVETLTAEQFLAYKRRILIEVTVAFIAYGASLHGVAATLENLAERLGVPAEFSFANSNLLFVRFLRPKAPEGTLGHPGVPYKLPIMKGDALGHLETRFIKVDRDFDLRKLDMITDVLVELMLGKRPMGRQRRFTDSSSMGSVLDGIPVLRRLASVRKQELGRSATDVEMPPVPQLAPGDDLHHLKAIEHEVLKIAALPPQVPDWAKDFVIVPLISAGIAVMFFDGPWISAALSLPLGLVPGVFKWLVRRANPLFTYLLEFFVSVLVGMFAGIIIGSGTFANWGLCFGSIGLAGIVWYIPGLRLVLSAMELATKDKSAGSSNLIYAIFIVLLLGFGLEFGLEVSFIFNLPYKPDPECKSAPIDAIWYLLLFPIIGTLFCTMLEASFPEHYILAVPAGALAFGTWYGVQLLPGVTNAGTTGFGLAVLLAAFAGCVPGFLYARVTKRSAFPVVYTAMQFVVPGGLSLKATLSSFGTAAGFTGGGFTERVLAGALGATVGAFLIGDVVRRRQLIVKECNLVKYPQYPLHQLRNERKDFASSGIQLRSNHFLPVFKVSGHTACWSGHRLPRLFERVAVQAPTPV